MATFCLPKFAAQTFKDKIISGEINPTKLQELAGAGSSARREFFQSFLSPEHAKEVNALFESKLLLKDQQAGMMRWIRSVTGVTASAKKDAIDRISALKEVLQPADVNNFLQDFASKKVGADITQEEAGNIAKLAQKAQLAREAIQSGGDRFEYGANKVAYQNYIDSLKNPEKSFVEDTKQTLGNIKNNPIQGLKTAVSKIGGLSKSIKAAFDDSFLGRQGLKVLLTHPKEWASSAAKSFELIAQQLGKKASSNEVLDAIKADIYSRPSAIDGTYDKMGLAIGTTEESFPTTIPERIPLLGRAFKASEVAFTGTAYRLRADLADKLLEQAKAAGADITDKTELKSLGNLVNSLTGRGNLGSFEKVAGDVNNLFFSVRYWKSNLDFLTAHSLDKNVSPFVRKQAAINLAKGIGAVASILTIANAVMPGSVEFDPRSADFGKIKIGNTRFDVTGGAGSILTLAARLATQSTKSSTTGKISKLDTGKFGSQTTGSVLSDYAANKMAPLFSAIGDLRAGVDRNKNPVNLTSVEGATNFASDLFMPLPVSNAVELYTNPKSAPILAGIIFDMLGISTNTYGK